VILVVAAAGGIYWYRQQPPERRERIKEAAAGIGTHLMDQYAATGEVQQARLKLRACLVPKPEQRSVASAIMRELAVAPESLFAQQLADLLDASMRPRVANLRAYFRGNDALFAQARHGGFELGRHYRLPDRS
jgi:hypothetical protein